MLSEAFYVSFSGLCPVRSAADKHLSHGIDVSSWCARGGLSNAAAGAATTRVKSDGRNERGVVGRGPEQEVWKDIEG